MRLDRAVVITCRETPERLRAFLDGWPAALDAPRIYAARRDDNPVRGCWQSHLAVMQQAEGPTLIFEDDAEFSPTFVPDVPTGDDWDLVNFGGDPCKTHAYAVRDPNRVAAMLGSAPAHGRHVCWYLGRRLPLKRNVLDPGTVRQREPIGATTS